MRKLIIQTFVLVCIFLNLAAHSSPADSFDEGRAGFSIRIKNIDVPYKEFAVFAIPSETLNLTVIPEDVKNKYSIETDGISILETGSGKWKITLPGKKGLYRLAVRRDDGKSILLNMFVTVPFSKIRDGYLNGYRIGKYPDPLKDKPYKTEPPHGFVEVTEQNGNTRISPHFTLKQFLCKQKGNHPKYVVIDENLILKLELLLREVNRKGYRCNSFHIMSGYRTPYYNKAIGNVGYGRHMWGQAADIFIDAAPVDGMMDDLNKDGKSDWHDANILYNIVESMVPQPWYRKFLGGLAKYKKTAAHGPFVHVDVRGYSARW